MEKELIGFVDLVAFNGRVYPFLLYSDKTMDCASLGIEGITKLYLKPRFMVETNDYIYQLPYQNKDDELIKDFVYDENIFEFLYENGMLSFSTDMAYLYDLPIKEGFDYNRRKKGVNSGTPYKWANKKGQVLTRQKNGNFN